MEKYAQYAAKNILQIRKSQLDTKLNRDLKNAARNYQAADAEMINDEDNNNDNREKEGEEEPEDDIDVPIANSYSHVVAITRMY